MGLPSEQLKLLVQRRDLLIDIADGVTDRRKLASRSGYSQSTVYRALKNLADADLLNEHYGHYELTDIGDQLFGHVQELYAEANVLNEFDGLTKGPELSVIKPCVFKDATVVTTERHSPNKPLEPVCQLLTATQR
ncbi:hypothetical protein [Halorussus caseinilyticus]|uniref:HVO-A0261-like N-terminal domain-containing protein n=1 Tax=Halorussus caseinilyticus TaxID=3034025 RepID=A0ABD5WI65_9EURY|nr:hypothetical protein [Halorussus sp. DT72]